MLENQMAVVKCARCGRRLVAAKSTARAMGPVCARKAKTEAVVLVAPVTITEKIRTSATHPGLSYELQAAAGRVFVTFRLGAAFEVLELAAGRAMCVDCSDRASMPPAIATYCTQVARQLAAAAAARGVA